MASASSGPSDSTYHLLWTQEKFLGIDMDLQLGAADPLSPGIAMQYAEEPAAWLAEVRVAVDGTVAPAHPKLER